MFFALALSQEKTTNLKVFQMMLISPVTYWLSNFLFDWPLFLLHSALAFIILGVMDEAMGDLMTENIGWYLKVGQARPNLRKINFFSGHLILGLLFQTACMLLMLYILTVIFVRIIIVLFITLIMFFLQR